MRPLFLLCPTRKGSLKTPGALLENLHFFLCCMTDPSGFQAPSSSCPHTHSDFFYFIYFIIINFFFFLPRDIRQDTFLGQTGKAVISWQRAWSCCKVVSREQSLRCGVLLGLCLSWVPWESTAAANGIFQRPACVLWTTPPSVSQAVVGSFVRLLNHKGLPSPLRRSCRFPLEFQGL